MVLTPTNSGDDSDFSVEDQDEYEEQDVDIEVLFVDIQVLFIAIGVIADVTLVLTVCVVGLVVVSFGGWGGEMVCEHVSYLWTSHSDRLLLK